MTIGRDVQRLVIGGGLFGCYAAILLAEQGHDVLVVEQGPELLARASHVHQARLHTGLHYPRSLLTASESLSHSQTFRQRWPSAVRDFDQIYAIATHNSKTSADDFADFIKRLQIPAQEVDPDVWFHANTVSRAFQVDEPTFDAGVMRDLIIQELSARPNVSVLLGTAAVDGALKGETVRVSLDTGEHIEADGVVLAGYAATNSLRRILGLEPIPLRHELAEVLIGTVTSELRGVGFTVMDGPFWSLMPFGHGDRVTLTSVGMTPLRTSLGQAEFACQNERLDCTPLLLQDCSTCAARPKSAALHHQQEMSMFLRHASAFVPTESLLTVMAVLTATEVDDARPTVLLREADGKITTVLSGKVSTLFDLERSLT